MRVTFLSGLRTRRFLCPPHQPPSAWVPTVASLMASLTPASLSPWLPSFTVPSTGTVTMKHRFHLAPFLPRHPCWFSDEHSQSQSSRYLTEASPHSLPAHHLLGLPSSDFVLGEVSPSAVPELHLFLPFRLSRGTFPFQGPPLPHISIHLSPAALSSCSPCSQHSACPSSLCLLPFPEAQHNGHVGRDVLSPSLHGGVLWDGAMPLQPC